MIFESVKDLFCLEFVCECVCMCVYALFECSSIFQNRPSSLVDLYIYFYIYIFISKTDRNQNKKKQTHAQNVENQCFICEFYLDDRLYKMHCRLIWQYVVLSSRRDWTVFIVFEMYQK